MCGKDVSMELARMPGTAYWRARPGGVGCCTLNVIGDLVLMDGDIPALASLGYRGD